MVQTSSAFRSWKLEVQKNNLDCEIYDYQSTSIADVELSNKNLKAVFSVGSTSLLYAKKIFNLDSYLIDLRNENGHPSGYKKAYYLAKKHDMIKKHFLVGIFCDLVSWYGYQVCKNNKYCFLRQLKSESC